MSGIQLPNAREVDILTNYFSATGIAGGNCSLRLFTNDILAGKTAAQKKAIVNADFTEATFAGYAAITLTAASWVITGGLPTAAVYAQQTFARSTTGAAQTVRGYWVRRVSDSALMLFVQWPGPITFEFIGDTRKITPRLAAKDDDD